MKAYAKKAGELGCEIFVQDPGWYTTQTENPDEGWWLRTGDWLIDASCSQRPGGTERLLPPARHGLRHLDRAGSRRAERGYTP